MPRIEIRPKENGPNLVLVDGNLSKRSADAEAPANKPFCDGPYEKIGFKAAPAELNILEETQLTV